MARDVHDRLLTGVRFTYQDFKTLPTDSAGTTELDLPGLALGQQIKVYLLSGPPHPNPPSRWC